MYYCDIISFTYNTTYSKSRVHACILLARVSNTFTTNAIYDILLTSGSFLDLDLARTPVVWKGDELKAVTAVGVAVLGRIIIWKPWASLCAIISL